MLSLKLNWGSKQTSFSFHWRTKATNITHLLFADDILIFFHANLQTISIINSCIHSFSLFSGLIPNIHKSQCFLACGDSETGDSILSFLGFAPSSFPARFLGVPLISSKLSYQDCIPLIHRITQKVSSWTATVLAYSGRLQLIVLFAIQAYWCNHFLLPKAAIRAIQSILCRFLWKGATLAHHGAKVAWKNLTLPVEEGGLGIKNTLDWNKALLILHLTHILQSELKSLWAKWVKSTVLLGKSIWQVKIPNDCSWIWKQLLKLRSTAILHLSYTVGSGSNTNLWFDPWLNGSALNPSGTLISNSGLSDTAKVIDILQNSSWNLPQSNHHEVIMFRRALNSVPVPTALSDYIL